MDNCIIQLTNISKSYKKKQILKDINLKINKGSIITFLGNNGTGKSTLLRIIAGLTPYTSGSIKGNKVLKFSYIPEHFPKLNIPIHKFMLSMGHIEGLTTKEINSIVHPLYEKFSLKDLINIPIKHLSKGSIQKVAVIQALLTKPDVLLMDEPLSGQDIKSQREFISLILSLKKENVTVLLSCHETYLVNTLATHVYEIQNHTLSPIQFKQIKQKDSFVLIYDSKDNSDSITHIISRENLNDEIIQMLEKGYTLISLKEADNEIDY